MPDDPNTKPGGEQKPEEVNVPRAELEKLRADAARIAKFDELAKEAEMENAEQLFETYEEFATNHLEQMSKGEKPGEKPATPAGEKPPENKPAAQPAPQGPDPVAVQALISSQFGNYKFDQLQMPEDQRDNIPEADLRKIIDRESQLVAHVARTRTGGDFVRAAALVYSLNKGQQKAKEDGAAGERARQNAAESAKLGLGGKPAEPKATSPQEQHRQYQENESRRIAGLPPLPAQT